MADTQEPPLPQDPPNRSRKGLGGRKAIALTLGIWLIAGIAFAVVAMPSTMDRLTLLLLANLLFSPAILASIALYLAVTAGALKREMVELQRLEDELQRVISGHKHDALPLSPIAQSRLDQLSAAQEQTDSQLAIFFSHRAQAGEKPTNLPARGNSGDDGQPSLALGEQVAGPTEPPGPSDLIRALHFPEDENDTDGFEALRKALLDPQTAPLIRAAQDVLTRLAQEGIYMDDLRPERARPEFWRAFARGTRGPLVSPLGGIRDRSCLALTTGRMRQDPEFRAAAHLFLREFDKVFADFEQRADDAQIVAMTDTRSARAFMLVGRVSGVFAR